MKNICVFGLGYIGLPTACLLATHGYKVTGVDLKKEVVEKINQGQAPFEESGLIEILQKAISSHGLVANSEPEAADVFLIAVPTPLDKGTKVADLSYVKEAARSIMKYLKRGDLVVLESTVPPGTSERLLIPVLEGGGLKAGKDFWLVYCPERAIPGNTLHEMINNNRIIGGIDEKSGRMAQEIYQTFIKGELHLTDIRTAELVKLMENTCRDINIALANEFAQIAEESGVNIWEAIELANKHPRINILKPGPGVGGHCLAIDPWFLAANPDKSRIISLARAINDSMPEHIMTLVKNLVGAADNPIITVMGVAYKGNVDDTRETPALRLIELAEGDGCQVRVHDPLVKSFERPLFPLQEAVRDSDCLVLITDHKPFRQVDPAEMARLMRNRNLVDTRNSLEHNKWRNAGFMVRVLGDGTHQG